MACGMVVQIPVTGAFGTDADFDLRTQLERELGTALAAELAGECGRGEIADGLMCVCLESITDSAAALRIVKGVLTRLTVLHRAVVVLETRSEADSDEVDRKVLWALPPAAPARVA